MHLGLSTIGRRLTPDDLRRTAQQAESLGYDSMWTAEAWGSDAFTPLAFVAASTTRLRLGTAIAQIWARTPGATAMTASDPAAAVGRAAAPGTRGVRTAGRGGVARRALPPAPRRHTGVHRGRCAPPSPPTPRSSTTVPSTRSPTAAPMPPGSAVRRVRRCPPRPTRRCSSPPSAPRTPPRPWRSATVSSPTSGARPTGTRRGATLSTARPDGFHVAPTVVVAMGDDLAACRDQVRPRIAMHVGGMGSKDQNFYKSLVVRYGYEDEAEEIQSRFLRVTGRGRSRR